MTATRATARRWGGDLAALVPLVVALPVLAGHDGGWGQPATLLLAGAAAVALPAVAGEARRWPRTATALLLAWTAGLVLATVAATYRADMVRPLLQYATAPVLVLATTRLWRRRWFPAALLVLVVVTFGLYQRFAWEVWWSRAGGGQGQWRPLSWHNQSAVLTGMVGVWLLGAGLTTTRVVRGGLATLAATGFAGAWLSGSRAGLAATLAAVVIVAVVGARSAIRRGEPWWRPVVVVGATAALAAVMVAGLLGMQPEASTTPLGGRDESVSQNSLARVEHAEAALGMFGARPLVGHGPGSYGTLARHWNDPNGNLTSSAHNEYVEVAAELGVLGLVGLLGVLVGAAVLGWRVLRTPPTSTGPDDLRGPLVVGAVGAAALFLAHSAVDFDWTYPVLSSLAAIAVGLLLAHGASARDAVAPSDRARWLADGATGMTVVALVGALAVGLVATRGGPAPWDEDAAVADARDALEAGRPDDALDALATTRRWNPAGYQADALAARARFALTGDAEALVASTRTHPDWFPGRARAALALARAGELDLAQQLLDELRPDLDRHAAWGVLETRLEALEVQVVVTVSAEGCAAAQDLVADALGDDTDGGALPPDAADVLAERLADEGCPPAA